MTPPSPCTCAGRVSGPGVFFLILLVATGVLFFVYTKPKLDSTVPAQAAPQQPPAEPLPEPKKPEPQAVQTAAPARSAAELAQQVAAGLKKRDFQLLSELLGHSAGTAQNWTENLRQALPADAEVLTDEVQVLGTTGTNTRLKLPLKLADGSRSSVEIEVARTANQKTWELKSLALPEAWLKNTPLPAQGPLRAQAPVALDPLAVGHDFVQALLGHDFMAARQWLDEERVRPERLAALCIVFEEGQYHFKTKEPLVMTLAKAEAAWMIAQVESGTGVGSEFGIEMQFLPAKQRWQVVGLNLSSMLQKYAAQAHEMGGVPYTPIIASPRGGESLALYFEYDEAGLHPRAQRQLNIVADLLKSDARRQLKIAGHTDAKGAEAYNLDLSRSRAEAVKKELVRLGVPEAQILTSGLGKTQPLSPNARSDGSDDPAGRSQNRRAEIYLNF
jgi:outer membrane protein OmpA-like peptidoglycan-associated protein